MRIAIVTTGSELLNGERSDINTTTIAGTLHRQGFQTLRSVTVPDIDTELETAIAEYAEKFDVLIITGGLGPTSDDITAKIAAKVFRRRLVLNDEALGQIERFFVRKGLQMQPGNEKQALLPQKAMILQNRYGSAPGFHLTSPGVDAFFLPGVPDEVEPMLTSSVIPWLEKRFPERPERKVKTFHLLGPSEAKVEQMVAGAGLAEEVNVAYSLDYPFINLRLDAEGPDAGGYLMHAERQLMLKLNDFVVAHDGECFTESVANLLIDKGVSLSLAESCTGGLVAKLLTDTPGASSFLDRSAVTYSDESKHDWLQVSDDILQSYGAVSEQCALAMARGIREEAGTDIAVAITGIAGPDGGSDDKPVGTVFISLTANGVERVKGYRFPGSRERVRKLSAFMALDWIRRYLLANRPQ